MKETGGGSQTLMRGLDVIESIADGAITLSQLSSRLNLTRSTTHRLASALVERGYLRFAPREGYHLGAKLLELGHIAREQTELIQTARPYLIILAQTTHDTVHFGILDDNLALYLDKVPGARRITISSRVGDRQPLTSTGLGKALMLDHDPTYWRERFDDRASSPTGILFDEWEKLMHGYVAAGRAFDLEENEDQIRCVAAPVRDAANQIVGAISVSSAAQYMDDARMEALSADVLSTAHAISADLGWNHMPSSKR